MKVLMLSPYFYPHIGGVENHVLNLSKELTSRGLSITVVTPQYDDSLKKEEKVSGIRILRYQKVKIPKIGQLIFLMWLLVNKDKIGRPDIIHGHDLYSKPLHWIFPKTPYFITFHGYEGYPLRKEYIQARQWFSRQVAGSIAVGHFIEKWYGVKANEVTYGAAEVTSKVTPKRNVYDACFIGRLEKDTGVVSYFDSLKILKESGIKFKLIVCGDGSLRRNLEAMTKENALDVKFVGMVINPYDYLIQSKVAFVSGYLSILGAMSVKKPVIAIYDNPLKKDYLEMIPNADKVMYIAKDASDVVEAISEILQDPKGVKNVVSTAFNWAHKQTWKKLSDDYLSLWDLKVR